MSRPRGERRQGRRTRRTGGRGADGFGANPGDQGRGAAIPRRREARGRLGGDVWRIRRRERILLLGDRVRSDLPPAVRGRRAHGAHVRIALHQEALRQARRRSAHGSSLRVQERDELLHGDEIHRRAPRGHAKAHGLAIRPNDLGYREGSRSVRRTGPGHVQRGSLSRTAGGRRRARWPYAVGASTQPARLPYRARRSDVHRSTGRRWASDRS